MNPSLINAIISLVPNAGVVVRGSGADAIIERINPSTAPITREEIESELQRLIDAEPARIAKLNRTVAYTTESDPLFFKAQRGEAEMYDWMKKIEEIKLRYPLTTDM